MKVALFGTFDVANFGDVLFPIVADEMLNRLDPTVTLERYSYRRKEEASWFYDVLPIQDFPQRLAETDLVLIGGGHLVHTNPHMAPGYVPTDPSIPHPFGFWWLPALAGRLGGVPVALHAPSADDHFPVWAQPLLRSFAESLDYANARELLSCKRLQEWGAGEVALIPDSIFSISQIMTRGQPSVQFERFKAEHGIDRPYLIVQPSPQLRDDQPAIQKLISEAQDKGWQVLELPIYQEKLNRVGFYASIPGVILTKYPPDPRLMAEIIANAHGVAGVSLHLSIVALCFGVPVYRKRYGPTSKFVLLDGLRNIHFLDEKPSLVESAFEPDPIILGYQATLEEHYRRLIELARRGNGRERRAVGWSLLTQTPYAIRATRSFGETLAAEKLKLKRLIGFASAYASPLVGKLTPKSVKRAGG